MSVQDLVNKECCGGFFFSTDMIFRDSRPFKDQQPNAQWEMELA